MIGGVIIKRLVGRYKLLARFIWFRFTSGMNIFAKPMQKSGNQSGCDMMENEQFQKEVLKMINAIIATLDDLEKRLDELEKHEFWLTFVQKVK